MLRVGRLLSRMKNRVRKRAKLWWPFFVIEIRSLRKPIRRVFTQGIQSKFEIVDLKNTRVDNTIDAHLSGIKLILM